MSDFYYKRKLYALLQTDRLGQNWQDLSDLANLEECWKSDSQGTAPTDETWIQLAEAIAISCLSDTLLQTTPHRP